MLDSFREGELARPDGRVVAWTEFGEPTGQPLLRIPGTPGSRWSLVADTTPWRERNLWAITTERPGFGRSTRLPGRGFAEHADDLAAILDSLGIDRIPVVGGSGAAPHILSFCALHPERVSAATVLVGIAPLTEQEVDQMIPFNAKGHRVAASGDIEAIRAHQAPVREAILDSPEGALAGLMETAPEEDREILSDPAFRATFAKGITEALAGSVDGWADESLAFRQSWSDFAPGDIATTVTWFHAAGDRNCPLSAAKRLVDQIPKATLVEWPEELGHLHGLKIEAEILDELLGRARS